MQTPNVASRAFGRLLRLARQRRAADSGAARPGHGGTFAGNRIPQGRLYAPSLNILRLWPEPNIEQRPGTSYNLEFLSPQTKTLVYQPSVRSDYQVSPDLRLSARFAGQRNFKGTTPGSIPGFNDTYNAYPWVKSFNTNNPLDSGFGFANAALGVFSSYITRSRATSSRATSATGTWKATSRTTGK